MFKLLSYIKRYKWYAILAPLFMLMEVALELMQPKFMATIIDKGVANGDTTLIWRTCVLMLATSCLAVVGGFGCTLFSTLTGQHFGTDLREKLFEHVLKLSFAETDRFKSSSLITRLTMDVNRLQHFVVICLRMMVRAPISAIGGCIMAVAIDWRMGGVLAVMIPVVIGVALLSYKVGRPLFAKIQKMVDEINHIIQENLSGLRVIRAFCRRDHEKKRFDVSNRQLADQFITVARKMSAIFPLGMLAMHFAILGVLIIGGFNVRAGNMGVGEVLAVISYISRVLFSFMGMAHMLQDFASTRVAAERIFEVLETSSSVQDDGTDSVDDTNGISLEFKDVTFRYPEAAGAPILQKLSFKLKPGERLAILGATGSGKSTVAQLIPRFYDCVDGQILLNGKDVRQYSLTSLRDCMAIVLQEAVLFSGTIAENILWGNQEASFDEVRQAATIAQADGFASGFNDQYDTIIGQKGITLSGGQKQRVAIARALLRSPKLLILDDCASALDVATEQALHKALNTQLKDTTVLIIAQRVTSALNADKIMVLSDGACAGIGTHEELLATCQVYREIVSSQTGEALTA
ncbi:MAG: ABC transporter ATP-binding protein [Victivallales bacterium]|nr:ABC transporter ATP-binding protein [Victivallales bacterium]